MLRVVVGQSTDPPSGYQSKRGVDDNWELNVAILVFGELKFRPLLCGLVECLILLLGVLHLLFD